MIGKRRWTNSKRQYKCCVLRRVKTQSKAKPPGRRVFDRRLPLGIRRQPQALEQFVRTHNALADTPEGLAAGYQAAELYRRLGRDVDALGEYRRMLAAISDPATYNNPWIALEQLKSGVLAAYQHYLGAQKFEFALQMTHMMQPSFSADQTLLLQAETYGLWGQALLNQADKGPRQ